jgi:LacI family transcriptional regulator
MSSKFIGRRLKKAKSPTLADVAGKLGVSEATVSLVVNDHPRISAQTKARVWQCIQELGYRPDPIGRALVMGRSSFLGLIVPDTSNPFFADIFRGAEDAARERGYQILLNNGSNQLDVEEQRIEELLELKIGGLIAGPAFTNPRQVRRTVWQRLHNQGFPVVLLNREMQAPLFHQISPDNAQGVRLSAELLAGLGHTRVAYISGIPQVLPVRQRLAAYQECAARLGFDRAAGLIDASPFTALGGYEACRRLWRRLRRKPTAIMALTDTVATGVLKYLSSEGVRVPEDVSLMGFDGTPQSEFSLIGISTVEIPRYEMGRRAVDLVDRAIANPGGEPESVVLPVHLVVRESTGPSPDAGRRGEI